jgi:outer membrane protein assembly factor BamB
MGDVSAEIAVSENPLKVEPNKNSAVVWHYGGPAPKGGNRDTLFGRTLSTCAIHDGLLYVADLDGFFHCLDAKTGQKYWDHDLKAAVWGSPFWVDGKVYMGNDDGDISIFADGKEKKQFGQIEMGRPVKTPPVVANGVLYVMVDTHLYAIQQK